MKAFFNSIIKPSNKSEKKDVFPAATNDASAATTTNPPAAAAAADAKDAKQQQPSQPASQSSATPTPANASPSTTTSTPSAASPPVPTTPGIFVSPSDRKHAKALMDDYVSVVQSIFDHSLPLKKETEYFLEQMEDWVGRDPFVEMPKMAHTARAINSELPVLREKSMQTTQAMSELLQVSTAHLQTFLAASAVKDEQRRTHAIPSLSRLNALRAMLEQDVADTKKQLHEVYVEEYKKMHDKYNRNMDGSRKKLTDAPTTAAAGGDQAAAASTAAASNAAPASSTATEVAPATTTATPAESSSEPSPAVIEPAPTSTSPSPAPAAASSEAKEQKPDKAKKTTPGPKKTNVKK